VQEVEVRRQEAATARELKSVQEAEVCRQEAALECQKKEEEK
jgi:hypothetical protein